MNLTKILTATAFAFAALTAPLIGETCCEKAKAAGKTCTHPCCIEATKAGKVCEKCNPKKTEKKEDEKK
jgi:hypothetical protein